MGARGPPSTYWGTSARSELGCHTNQLQSRVNPQLGVRVGQMGLDGPFPNMQPDPNLGRRAPLGPRRATSSSRAVNDAASGKVRGAPTTLSEAPVCARVVAYSRVTLAKRTTTPPRITIVSRFRPSIRAAVINSRTPTTSTTRAERRDSIQFAASSGGQAKAPTTVLGDAISVTKTAARRTLQSPAAGASHLLSARAHGPGRYRPNLSPILVPPPISFPGASR